MAQASNKHFWTKVFIALGFVALFICGMAVGLSVNRGGMKHRGPMTEAQCAELEKNIMFMEDTREQRKLSAFYNRHCWKKDKRSTDRVDTRPAARVTVTAEIKKCEAVETALKQRLGADAENPSYEYYDAAIYVDRAETYANLANRGCPENAEKYRNFALKDIEVAKALKDDRFNDVEIVEVVETYKKLNMKAEAEKILDKAKQLTDPAIDFILQIEKIINE